MSSVNKRIEEEACRLARKSGKYLPSGEDKIRAQMNVLSGSKNEIKNMADEVAAYNTRMVNNAK